jgi:predicted peptidase
MTAMQLGGDNTERLRELAARIAAEQDHDKFTVLVKEFNQLLDDEKQQPEEPRKP